MKKNQLRLLVCLLFATLTMNLFAMESEVVPGGSDLPNLRYLTNINGVLYFDADASLQKFDAVEDDVLLIKAGLDGIAHWGLTDASVGANVAIYFATHIDVTGEGKLWKSDGTDPGTVVVPGTTGNRITGIAHAGAGQVYFSNDNASGDPEDPATKISELFTTDGTTTTTIKAGIVGQVRGLTAIGGAGTAFFTMYVYDETTGENVYQLWKTDGTGAGTVMIKDGFNEDISYWFLADVGGVCYFPVGFEGDEVEEESTFELWKSDGTTAGTTMVKDGLEIMIDLTDVNGTLYFSTFTKKEVDDDWCEIWKSDGTADGTILVKGELDTIHSGDLAAVGSELYFADFHEDAEVPYSTIWKTDGTEIGTSIVEDKTEEVHDLVNANDVLYYAAYSLDSEVPTAQVDSKALATVVETANTSSNYIADLMVLKEVEIIIVKLAVGSVITVTPGDVSSELATEKFSKKPKVFGILVNRTKTPPKTKKGTMKVIEKVSSNNQKSTLHEMWNKKMRIYNKKDYKQKNANNQRIATSTLLASNPVVHSMMNGIFIQAKEFAGNDDPVQLDSTYMLACPEVTGVIGSYAAEGDEFTVQGTLFGSKRPKILVEYKDAKGNAKYKKCKLYKKYPKIGADGKFSTLRFSDAKEKPNKSCMKIYSPDPNDAGEEAISYSEVTVLYPKLKETDIATGYIILDNGVGLCSYLLP